MSTDRDRIELEADRLEHLDELRANQRAELARALLVATTGGVPVSHAATLARLSRPTVYELLELARSTG